MNGNPRWQRRPEGSTWGDFGPDDQLGRINLLTPEKVLQGVAEVKEGRRFCLSLPLDLPGGRVLNPRRYPPTLRPTQREDDGSANINFPMSKVEKHYVDVVNDDAALICLQYSTQWDSLAHVGQLFDADGDGLPEIRFYNGYRGGIDVQGPLDHLQGRPTGVEYTGTRALGIQNMAEQAIQGRGVLIDLRAHFGDRRHVVGWADLRAVMQADGVTVEPGDMVLFHTGFADRIVAMRGEPDPTVLHGACTMLDGRDPELLKWITDSGLAAIIADNYAIEAHPSRPGEGRHAALPLHEHCLFKLGVPIGEIWYLTELAAWLRSRGRSRFLLTAPPLRLPGAVGSPATPVATA